MSFFGLFLGKAQIIIIVTMIVLPVILTANLQNILFSNFTSWNIY